MRLALLAEAEAELGHAVTWYDDRSEGLGDEFMSVAREAMFLIAESAGDEMRRRATERTPRRDTLTQKIQ